MSPTPFVSVILPTYNRAATLDRAIRSVLNQTFDDLELIVVDDGSTDESPCTLKRYAGLARVRVISSAHRGCSGARNLGITCARAPLIAFQDSDDEWFPRKLERAVAALSSPAGSAEVFYSNMIRIHEDGSSREWRSPEVFRGTLVSERTLDYQVAGIGIQTAVIKRTCFDQVGLFDELLPRLIDLDLFVRLSDHFGFHHHDEPLVKYYATNGISTDTQALVRARRYLIAKYRSRLRLRKHHLIHQYLFLADALRMNRSRYRSRMLAGVALLASPTSPRVRQRALDILRVASNRC
jgi:glycosyltransferase involved in cell wall biosynthesis